MAQNAALTNLQVELMKLYARQIPESDLLEIRALLAAYFANKAMDETDRLWEENNWDDETMKQWIV
ncbi:hypothetical protein ACO2Q8_26815 [Larkinella sp. VNQ87]|uniref:hypothetical protein n=1 Tax=Larkinella sp. VNQ87 TaxID=3400921 RepID=UPI003C0B5F16